MNILMTCTILLLR